MQTLSAQPHAVALPAATIDRDSPAPFYFQLAELLEHEIVSGRWERGAQLPSEPAIAERFELSRSTVRQALARLEQEGLISRRKGEGTFVDAGSPRSWLLQSAEGFFREELLRTGRRVTSRILRLERAPLPPWACDLLDVAPGCDGVAVERLRAVDELVALYVVNYLPAHLAETVVALDDGHASLYERLAADHGLRVSGGKRTLEAVTAGERLASLLEVAPASAVAFIESVSWDRNQVPFDCYRAWVRTDRMRIDVQVASSPLVAPHLLDQDGGDAPAQAAIPSTRARPRLTQDDSR